jgi:tetratricopeptide (TPR) repeat protein
MKHKFLLLLLLSVVTLHSWGQAPKWLDKTRSAVFSLIAYDADGKMLHSGNGFFIGEDGTAIADYSVFEGAQRAVVVDAQGKQMEVEMILGANEMYDVTKFLVNTGGKKVTALSVAQVAPANNTTVFLLPYSTQKGGDYAIGNVQRADRVEGSYNYYTLALALKDKMVSCPLVNNDGQVFALAQKSSGADSTTVCYGMDVKFANNLQVSSLSFNDNSLTKIGIKKALPDTEEDALGLLYMVSMRLSLPDYLQLLNDFLEKFPNSADGYLRRANVQLAIDQSDDSMRKVEADLDNALKSSSSKAEVYYNKANIIYSYLGTNPQSPYKNWNVDSAVSEVNKAIQESPLPMYYQLKGDILFSKADYAGAYEAYDAVNHSSLVSAASLYSAAKTKELMQDSEAALALMDSCIAKFAPPYTTEAAPYLLERGRMRDEAGQSRQALLDYDEYYRAVSTQVNDVFYYLRGQVAFRARVYQRALDDFAEAIEMNPQELTYRAELAVVNMRVGRNEEALNVLAEAEKIDPSYSEIYRLKGLTLVQMKRNSEACENFNKAKKLGNTEAQALIDKYCN